MSIQFDGSSQYLETGALSDLPHNALPLSLAIWANLDTLAPAQQVLIGVGTEAFTTWSYIELMVLASGKGRLRLRNSLGTGIFDADTVNTITAGGWHLFVGVLASATDRRAYLNGDIANRGQSIDLASINATPNRLKIGKRPNGGPNDFADGRVAYPAYWKYAITEADVASLYSGVHPMQIRPESLGEAWDLNGAGNIVPRLGRIPLVEIGSPTTGADDPAVGPVQAIDSTTRSPRPAAWPLATEPLAVAFGPSLQSSVFLDLIRSRDPGQYLIEITAYKGGEARSGGISTLAELPLATIPMGGAVDVGQVSFLYGDMDWTGAPGDALKPNVYYEGRASIPLLLERQMPLLPEEERRVQRQFGLIELANGDGGLDSIIRSYAVDGRRVRVLFGPRGGAYSDFRAVAEVLGTGWEGDDLAVRLGIRDQSYSLDLPLQGNLYEGAGGAEGTSEIEGKPKPLCYGRCRNLAPTQVDPANLIYQVHDGPILAVDDVFDRGAALTASGIDVASYAALAAQSVSAGQYATALAVGMFKLGSSPDGLITCDVRGDADPDYADTLDVICLRMLKDRAGLASRWISDSTFAGAAAIGGELGIYIGSSETPTTAQAVSAMLAAVGGWWGAARDGRIRAGRLSKPEDRTPNLYIDQYDILSLDPETAPVPRWRQRVAYQRNWTEQRGEDLAASVTPERRQFLTERERVVSAAEIGVRVRHLQALDPDPLPTLYEDSADAQALADYLLALHSPDRRIFSVALKRLGYLADLQTIVRMTYPRFGLGGGQNFAVIGIREDADRDETTLRLWG